MYGWNGQTKMMGSHRGQGGQSWFDREEAGFGALDEGTRRAQDVGDAFGLRK